MEATGKKGVNRVANLRVI